MSGNRSANLDLLRLVAMFCIVVGHCIMYAVIGADGSAISIDVHSVGAMVAWGEMYWMFFLASIGVNCFVMLSGYLLAESGYRWKSVMKTWLATFTYSFGITLIFLVLGRASAGDLLRSVAPVYFGQYWFMSMYIGLALVAPFLSKLVSVLSKRDYIIMLIVLSVLNLRLFKFPYGEIYGGPMSLVWFVYLFLVGAFVRKYRPFETFRHFGKCYFAFGILLASAYMILQLIQYKLNGRPLNYGGTFNNSFTFVTSLLIFLWAVYLKIPSERFSRVVCSLGPLALGVYLVSEHPLLRNAIWNETFHLRGYINSPWVPVVIIGVSLVVFAAGLLVEWVRQWLFNVARIDAGVDRLFKK